MFGLNLTPVSLFGKAPIEGLARAWRLGHNLGMPLLKKRSILLSGHATSMALEPEFWAVLDEMAATRGVTLAVLIAQIDETRGERPLASACRVAALTFARG